MAGWLSGPAVWGHVKGWPPLRASPLAVLCSGNEVYLSSEVEHLLLGVVAEGFVLYCCGHRAGPSALVASYPWIELCRSHHYSTLRSNHHGQDPRPRT